MRDLLKIIVPCFLLSISCVEKVDLELDQYVKVLSLDRSSFAEKVIELDNGDLMILGEIGTSSFDQESTGQGSEINSLEDQAPFIAITDLNGNLKMLRMYPFEDMTVISPFGDLEVINVNNTTSFHNILQTNDGGYIVHAQSLGFDYIFNGQLIESQPGSLNYNDFLIRLNSNFDIEHIQTMQGHPEWDGIIRVRGQLKRISDDNIGFLISQRIIFPSPSTGFTFLHLTDELDTVRVTDIEATSELIGQNFAVENNNEISILTTTQSNFEVLQAPIENISLNASTTIIAGDGILNGENRDENFIEVLPDGSFVLVYTQPAQGIIMEHRGSDMTLLSGPHSIEKSGGNYSRFTLRATRAVRVTADNQLLIYVLNIPGIVEEGLSGELFKVSLNGEIQFRKTIEGVPGDVTELLDGSVVTVSNKVYNGSLQKIHITKMDGNGKLF